MLYYWFIVLISLWSLGKACFTYTVVAGDTCNALAQKFSVDMSQITDLSDGGQLCVNCRMWVGDSLQICGSGPPSPPSGIQSILSESQYNQMFPSRNVTRYSYSNFISASQRPGFTQFCNGSDATANKRELAMFLANAGHESIDFTYVCEACSSTLCGQCSSAYNYGGDSTHQYYGRGALQLSWNYNYQACGNALGIDLLGTPTLIESNSDLVFATALWFWMNNSSPTCHSVAQGNMGFGQTIKIINGGLECGQQPGSNGYNEMIDRVNRYHNIVYQIGVDPGSNLTC